MKPRFLAGVLTALVSSLALAALKEGDAAPDFTAPASLAGKAFTYSLQAGLAKGPVVVYFYRSAFTSGCNLEAHTFSVDADKFAAAGASIIGVSLDSIERLNAFSADRNYCAGRFAVASDADGAIAREFDLKVADAKPGLKDTRGREIGHGFAERTTFVVDRSGRIAAAVGGMSPEANVRRALEAVRRLAAGR